MFSLLALVFFFKNCGHVSRGEDGESKSVSAEREKTPPPFGTHPPQFPLIMNNNTISVKTIRFASLTISCII